MDTHQQRMIAEAESLLLNRLNQMLQLLGNSHWSEHFRDVRAQWLRAHTWDQKNAAASRIRSVYGGMGSFNDWYLERDVDGIDFDTLKSELYELSRMYERPEIARALLGDEGLA